jgi:alkanesulfonate monooxygenase SsuD/methylene tetrahydromethanopterin reductase-like flavin-dependent oxidoreductase (luciferase family)
MKHAGRNGYQPFGHCLIAGNVNADLWKTYEQAALEAGREPKRSDWKLARSIFIADTTAEARKRVRTNSLGKCFDYIGTLLDGSPNGRKLYKRDPNMSNADCNMDYWLEEQIIAGDVDEVLDRLLRMIEETGPFGKLILMGYDWDDKQSWLDSMGMFANELMPALNKAVCGVSV